VIFKEEKHRNLFMQHANRRSSPPGSYRLGGDSGAVVTTDQYADDPNAIRARRLGKERLLSGLAQGPPELSTIARVGAQRTTQNGHSSSPSGSISASLDLTEASEATETSASVGFYPSCADTAQ
jgi:hypothetical protein